MLIEQKGAKIDLYKKEKQSDGSELTPYEQAKRYDDKSPFEKKARWIIVCNFHTFLIYDMNKEQPEKTPIELKLENLDKEYKNLSFLVDNVKNFIRREEEISVKAGEIVGKLYDALIKLYHHPEKPETLKSLNILCVRIVFCLYAEDSGLFGKPDAFHDYLMQYTGKQARKALIELFDVLNTNLQERDEYLDPDLAVFPYVNGGLFANKNIEIPNFTDEVLKLILIEASEKFDWHKISPTIFGAVFESTLNPETRRNGGMHYTSLKNIHKVIDPLFLDELKAEYDSILEKRPVHTANSMISISMKEKEKRRLTNKADRDYMNQMYALQDKLSKLIFFDPACGSGNFLTETYISLRHLENKIIQETLLYGGGSQLLAFAEEDLNPIKVSISQFYGIEINDFAVTVAKTALWIAESQMMEETIGIINRDLDFFPLKTNAYIHEGNALRTNWRNILIPRDNVIILGNPPFLGYSNQSKEQKNDIVSVYIDENGSPYNKAGKIDYVAGWYFKAAEYIHMTKAKAAFVSTNSITQGEQVADVWEPLIKRFNIHIDFAYKTFQWESESNQKAHVHCVIIGFSNVKTLHDKFIFDGDNKIKVSHINPYLLPAKNVFIHSRTKPLCDVNKVTSGNRPADGGALIIEGDEYNSFIKKEPGAIPYIKKFMGAEEYINKKPRYCLWLVGASPTVIRSLPLVAERVRMCREDRLKGADDRKKLATTPTLFRETKNPENFIIIPRHSSVHRNYVPMGYLGKDVIVNDAVLIIPNATLYDFGILISSIHMSWMRAICGRLKSDYRYSANIVYNNFPWPSCSDVLKKEIAQTANHILEVRGNYPNDTLAALYDPHYMPSELIKAHTANDKAVMKAYGFNEKTTDEVILQTKLIDLYQELIVKEG